MSRKKKTQNDTTSEALDALEVEEAAAAIEAEVELVVEPVVAAPAPQAPVRGWRVPRACRVSIFGQITNLPAGSIVMQSDYGPEGIARLREQIEDLEPLTS